jgi:hypothetical protein
VVAGTRYYKCSQAWVVTNSTYTPAAVALAEANDVRLIDGNELTWLAENPDSTTDHGERYRALAEVKATFGLAPEDNYFDYETNRHSSATTFTAGGITITREQIEKMTSRERNVFVMSLTQEQLEALTEAGLDLSAILNRSGTCSICSVPTTSRYCPSCEARIAEYSNR